MFRRAKAMLDKLFPKEVDAILRHRPGEGFKQALLLRADLGMGKGKLVAQGSHASLHGFQKCVERDARVAYAWDQSGCRKIVLRVDGEPDLFKLYDKAKKAGLPCVLIRDAGETQVPAGTPTAVGIGPWNEAAIDAITKELKLL